MRWIHLIVIATTICGFLSEETVEESNDVSSPSSKINLDSNLRRALLKALTELENEESHKAQYSLDDDTREKIVEKASAASVSIFSNGESVTIAPVSTSTVVASTTPEQVTILFQKSESHQQPSITTIEKADENESFQTSASSNFANQPFGKDTQDEKNEKNTNQNSIYNNDKYVTKSQKVTVTTSAPRVTTQENEAKVENIQFFSAPLVAAFTVHQDEAGLPKKVEPIFKTHIPTKTQEAIIIEKEQQIKQAKQQEQVQLRQQEQVQLRQQQQEKIRLEDLKRQQEKLQLQEKIQLQQKQKALEEEIYRLNLSLRQQHQIFLKQQEELRVRNNVQSFIPINNPNQQQQLPFNSQQQQGFKSQNIQTTDRPILNQLQQVPFNNQQQAFKPQNSQFNPLVEAGKLPINAQFLPVKGPVDFRVPFALNSQTNHNNFNQQSNSNLNQQNQSNRVFRQNVGVGNFGFNNDFNRNNNFNRNTNSFSIQPAISVDTFGSQAQNNRFFRSNLESSLTAPQPPQTSFLQPPVQQQQVQNTRFFRSNLEGSFSSPNNNFQLGNLLYNSGAFRGKSSEDLSLITKVLGLNHYQGGNGVSLRPELRQQFTRNF